MVFHFDGRYRSALECKFLEQVEEDLTQFWSICGDHSVLVFPSLSARYRFLIHQLVGRSSKLQTVSVGQGQRRRTVVYFAPERDPDKMAHSLSTSQKTFFGRGRGRRPRWPDQALYVPGALRKAKCDQLKQNASTESTIKNRENKSENREISKNSKGSNNDEPSTEFTPNDDHYSIKPRSAVHEAQTDDSACDSVLSTSEREVDSNSEETDNISFGTTVQHTNGPSHMFIGEQLWSETKESNRENVIEDDSDPVVTTSEKLTSNAIVKEFDDISHIRDKTDKSIEKSVQKVTGDQILDAIFKEELACSYGESYCKKDVDVNGGVSQTPLVTSEIGNDHVDSYRSPSPFEYEICECVNEKPLTENVTIPDNENEAMLKSETNCGNASIVVAMTAESNSLGTENQSFQDGFLIKPNKDSEAAAAGTAIVDLDGEDNVEWNESWNGNEEAFQSGSENKGNSGALTLSEGGVFNHEEELKHAGNEEDVTTCELIDNQSKLFNDEIIEEGDLRTSKEDSIAVCKNAVNSKSNSLVNPTSSTDNENLESENSKSESGNIKDENIQTLSRTTEDASESVRTELDENVGEVETAKQQKTSKIKKGKKSKSKEQTEDKVKPKEKGEKKRKKEKKSVKDKIDKEVILDSEEEMKKSKPKRKSAAEEQDNKVLSMCHIDTGKELMADSSCSGESCSAKNDNGDDDDDDNWELNFDESGDCLNPDYLEELSRLTGIAKPEVHKTQYDYYSFKPREMELDDEEFGHILEIYNFSSDVTTQDLTRALSSFRDKGFDIKWVDDTHALAVFASRHAAQDAIQLCSGPIMKLRPVSEGTTESKKKAHYCSEFLQPYRERPQTSKLLADRLVTGALGMRSKMTREERVKEREKIKEAKSKRQQEKIQKAQIWGD